MLYEHTTGYFGARNTTLLFVLSGCERV